MTVSPPPTDTDRLADELAGWPLGAGYYQYTVGSDDAREMAAALAPVVSQLAARRAAEEWQAGWDAGFGAGMARAGASIEETSRARAAALVAAHPDQGQQR